MTDDVPARATDASELDGVDDMREFIGHTAWKSAPTVRVDVDADADLLTMTFYQGHPDVEIESSAALSVGFHWCRDEYLLTSLCLYGVASWAAMPTPAEPAADIAAAQGLAGRSAGCAVRGLLGGGSSTLDLPAGETDELLPAWRRFVDRHAGRGLPVASITEAPLNSASAGSGAPRSRRARP